MTNMPFTHNDSLRIEELEIKVIDLEAKLDGMQEEAQSLFDLLGARLVKVEGCVDGLMYMDREENK